MQAKFEVPFVDLLTIVFNVYRRVPNVRLQR